MRNLVPNVLKLLYFTQKIHQKHLKIINSLGARFAYHRKRKKRFQITHHLKKHQHHQNIKNNISGLFLLLYIPFWHWICLWHFSKIFSSLERLNVFLSNTISAFGDSNQSKTDRFKMKFSSEFVTFPSSTNGCTCFAFSFRIIVICWNAAAAVSTESCILCGKCPCVDWFVL